MYAPITVDIYFLFVRDMIRVVIEFYYTIHGIRICSQFANNFLKFENVTT